MPLAMKISIGCFNYEPQLQLSLKENDMTERETLLAEIAAAVNETVADLGIDAVRSLSWFPSAQKAAQARLAELDAEPDWLPCAHCGGEVDPQGWFDSVGERGPECDRCGVTAPDKAAWNQRAALPMGECQPRWPSEAELREMADASSQKRYSPYAVALEMARRIRAYQKGEEA
jgi:hypothetical protein